MSRLLRVSPTRLNLLRSLRKLERVREGTALLRRKREALVRELLTHARPAVDARESIARAADRAYPELVDALAGEGSPGLSVAGLAPGDKTVEMESAQLWGITVWDVSRAPGIRRTLEARGTAPGPTPAATVSAAGAFEVLAELLLEAAPREMLLRRLGRSVARTSRQVRALEHRVDPDLAAAINHMSRLLDEREREDHLRLRHFLRKRRSRADGRHPDPASTGSECPEISPGDPSDTRG
ncbi:MAG: V-type ATP synthase subunit D [Gemmatimonadota bacterium]|nr:V-type ATP synthase subunit D [Gemmatimonadota bacterium]MDH5758946.1 V-type ATP synthase subunit D [Gemmatimonadota bacterium]